MIQRAFLGVLLACIVGYMLILPVVQQLMARSQPETMITEVQSELSATQEAQLRASKLAIFLMFCFVGASAGSFLNVVAYSLPRQESFALRSSACPQCGANIRRIDNLPIISYLRLGGKCRNCNAVIPLRYFLVESIGAAIFGSLFAFELLTGAANVPGFHGYSYTGIVWIVFYTKWDVVALYFFHATLLSVLMLVALIDMQRQRIPWKSSVILVVVFACLPIVFSDLLPIRFNGDVCSGNYGPSFSLGVRPLNALIGISAAMVLSPCLVGVERFLWAPSIESASTSSAKVGVLFIANTMIGASLGWQAVIVICVIWLMLALLVRLISIPFRAARSLTGTSMLFIAAWLHQPFWKTILDLIGRIC